MTSHKAQYIAIDPFLVLSIAMLDIQHHGQARVYDWIDNFDYLGIRHVIHCSEEHMPP